jgi:hypothetical protein
MQKTETVLSIIREPTTRNDHWRARYGETRSAGSGRGRRKRTRTAGTSPAAYFTQLGESSYWAGPEPASAEAHGVSGVAEGQCPHRL